MALHYDVDTDVNGDDLSGFGIWLAALHDDHEDDVGDVCDDDDDDDDDHGGLSTWLAALHDDHDDVYKMVMTTSCLGLDDVEP